MRNSNLLKWAQNMNNKSGKDAETRSWIHPPEALSSGHIVYLVKFLGNLEVDQPKGIEVVKEGIRKLKFNQQHNINRKSEGSKLPKVELTISVDGVTIQEPKTKRIMHQYPLHRISYCADDKAERRFFSFIVKETNESEQHMCFVFLSEKLAAEITLTIGQAFDLAYKLSQNDAIWSTSWGGSKSNKRTFRSCHLDVNKPLPLYYADELPDLKEYAGRAVPQMPTGMEKDEEAEHHLQRAIITGHVIPTPEVYSSESAVYDQLYPSCFILPRRLIHMQPFTLEQDIPEYDIDSEDEEWLKSQSKSIDLPNNKFEEMVDRLERNSDHTVVNEQDAKSLLRDYDESLIIAVYDYWLNKRFKTKHNLLPVVKTEVRGNIAVNDPYLAFRRRKDKMQTRKNRKNDEYSYEKMIKLNWDLNSAQYIVELVKKREHLKKDLVQSHIDILKKRYEMQDWSGHQYQDAVLLSKALRNNNMPLTSNKFNSWSSSPTNKKYGYAMEDELVPKKEKRHYKKRKVKNVISSSSEVATSLRLSSDDEQSSPQISTVEDNYFTFRRQAGVSYLAPKKSGIGGWPYESLEEGGQADPRHRFNPVIIRKPVPRCIGLARRRIGRGGRVILDRVGPSLDDVWKDLDVNIIENYRFFRPQTPPPSFCEDSDAESEEKEKIDSLKPFLEIEETVESTRQTVPPVTSPALATSETRKTLIELSFHKPLKIDQDTTDNILEIISKGTKGKDSACILDPFYQKLIKKKLDIMKSNSSGSAERWSNSLINHIKEDVPYEFTTQLGSSSVSIVDDRQPFFDIAAREQTSNKRKYAQICRASTLIEDEPQCSKCKRRKMTEEAVIEQVAARNNSVKSSVQDEGVVDYEKVIIKLIEYMNNRIVLSEHTQRELKSRLKSKLEEYNVTHRKQLEERARYCHCPPNSGDKIIISPVLQPHCAQCGKLKYKANNIATTPEKTTPIASSTDVKPANVNSFSSTTKKTPSSSVSSPNKSPTQQSIIQRLCGDYKSCFDNDLCICDISTFPSSLNLTLPTLRSILNHRKCMLTKDYQSEQPASSEKSSPMLPTSVLNSASRNLSSTFDRLASTHSSSSVLDNRLQSSKPSGHSQELQAFKSSQYLLPNSGIIVWRGSNNIAVQANDGLHRRFLEMEVQRRLMILQQRVNTLETENNVLKKRLRDIANGQDVDTYMKTHGLTDITEVPNMTNTNNNTIPNNNDISNNNTNNSNNTNGSALLLNLNDTPSTPTTNGTALPPIPPRSFQNDLLSDLVLPSGVPSVGRKLEGLLLDEIIDDDFDPRAYESTNNIQSQSSSSIPDTKSHMLTPPPLLAPPPNNSRRTPNHQEDIFGLTPFNDKGSGPKSQARDPFGMGDFSMGTVPTGLGNPVSKDHGQDLESAIGILDRRISEMKDGFSRGLAIGTEDFSIESLDPLRK